MPATSRTIPTYDLVAAKYDGTTYRIFTNNILLSDDAEKTVFYSPCGSPFLNVSNPVPCASACDEFIVMFKQKHYNIVILLRDNELLEYYINLTLIPEALSGDAMKFIDMDVDLSFTSNNREVKVLDLDEFEQNAVTYQYSETDKTAVKSAVEDLKTMVAGNQYYFSRDFVAHCKVLLKELMHVNAALSRSSGSPADQF